MSQGDTEESLPSAVPAWGMAIDLGAGLTSGVIQAGLLNPWDRALYLSVKDSTAFLSKANWNAPYHGFSQAVVGRAIAGETVQRGVPGHLS